MTPHSLTPDEMAICDRNWPEGASDVFDLADPAAVERYERLTLLEDAIEGAPGAIAEVRALIAAGVLG